MSKNSAPKQIYWSDKCTPWSFFFFSPLPFFFFFIFFWGEGGTAVPFAPPLLNAPLLNVECLLEKMFTFFGFGRLRPYFKRTCLHILTLNCLVFFLHFIRFFNFHVEKYQVYETEKRRNNKYVCIINLFFSFFLHFMRFFNFHVEKIRSMRLKKEEIINKYA